MQVKHIAFEAILRAFFWRGFCVSKFTQKLFLIQSAMTLPPLGNFRDEANFAEQYPNPTESIYFSATPRQNFQGHLGGGVHMFEQVVDLPP